MRTTFVLSLLAASLVVGCVDTRPSEGRCTGTFRGQAIDLPIDAATSEYHRDDDILGDDDGPFALHYGADTIVVNGELQDMPTSRDVGTHAVSSDFFHAFDISVVDEEPPALSDATMTLDEVHLDRMVGSVDTTFEDGSALHCTYDLRRAFELDTDD